MAGVYTAQQIIDRALRKADMYGSNYISPEEQMDLLNETYTELYDTLVSSFEEYFIKDNVFITLVPGTFSYPLPADFYKGVGVDYQLNVSGTGYITLKPFTEMERNGLTGIIGAIPAGTVKLRYIPTPTVYTDPLQIIDSKIAGWETLMVVSMAIAMRSKEESDTRDLERQRAQLMERLKILNQNRDIGFPARVNDVQKIDVYQQFATLRYQYSGDVVRFLPTEIISPIYVGIY